MCGLAAIISKERPVDSAQLIEMAQILAHRGPDARTFATFDGGRVGFAHTRLSVIDREGGAQPMNLATADLTIVYNGEISKKMQTKWRWAPRNLHRLRAGCQ